MATITETKVGAKERWELVRVRPPRIAQVLLAASLLLHFWLRERLDWHLGSWPGGLALLLGGFALMIWAWRLFREKKTAICPTDAASFLVERGPFRWTRNPMYLGMTAMLAGCAWVAGTLPAVIAPLGFFLVMNAVFVPFEERRLAALFGTEYEEYCGRVRRWI